MAMSDHPVMQGAVVGLMSGENPGNPDGVEPGTTADHDSLIAAIKDMGLEHEHTDGKYGATEKSVLIHNPTREQMIALGKKFGQRSVVWGPGGKQQLIYTHIDKNSKTPHEDPKPGQWHEAKGHKMGPNEPDDFWTKIPGHGYYQIDFDFDKVHGEPDQAPAVISEKEPMGKTVSDKTYELEEVQEMLTKATRAKIDALEKEFRGFRERELAKSSSMSKALIPPHKHTIGGTVGGTEDVPPGKLNPPGKNDALKSDDKMSKELLCKLCKKSTCKAEACKSEKAELSKAILSDAKGNIIDNGINPKSVLPGDKKCEVIEAEGSGGKIEAAKAIKGLRAKAKKKQEEKSAELSKSQALIPGDKSSKKLTLAEPPMAKPPSGKNMATHVPASKPATPKLPAKAPAMAPPKAPAPKAAGVAKGDFGLDEGGKPLTAPAPAARPSAPPKKQYTGADLAAAKKSLGRPGIFGKLPPKSNKK